MHRFWVNFPREKGGKTGNLHALPSRGYGSVHLWQRRVCHFISDQSYQEASAPPDVGRVQVPDLCSAAISIPSPASLLHDGRALGTEATGKDTCPHTFGCSILAFTCSPWQLPPLPSEERGLAK